MERCFVIQPFDNDKFDKRFKDVYSPAIIDARNCQMLWMKNPEICLGCNL